MIPRVKVWLKPGGRLLLTHLSWLPRQDRIAQASEQLVLRYNPQWTDADFPGNRTIQHPWSTRDFKLVTYHAYEEGLPYEPVTLARVVQPNPLNLGWTVPLAGS